MTIDLPTQQMVTFLREVVGLTVIEDSLADQTFLPGLTLRGAALVYDPKQLRYPGDLLHEAGHLAVIPSAVRESNDPALIQQALDDAEVAAIAWSYAAICYLGLPIALLFHPDGYKGRSESLQLSFSMGIFPGLPQLEARGLAVSPRNAAASNIAPYPAMQRWICA